MSAGSTGASGSSDWTSSERMPTAGTDEPGTNDGMLAPGESAAPALSDAQVAAVTNTVHNTEIEQAQLAQAKSKDPHVLSFASMMINHHGQAIQRESALGLSTASSPLLQTLSTEGRQKMATLRDKTGRDFDRAYIQAQIEQHQKVLDTLDRQLMPSAKNPQLRTHLQSMRPTIAQHLQAARDAQQAMNTSGSTGTKSSSDRPHPTGSGR